MYKNILLGNFANLFQNYDCKDNLNRLTGPNKPLQGQNNYNIVLPRVVFQTVVAFHAGRGQMTNYTECIERLYKFGMCVSISFFHEF